MGVLFCCMCEFNQSDIECFEPYKNHWMFYVTLILVQTWKYCDGFLYPSFIQSLLFWLQCYVIFVLASPITVTAAVVGFCMCRAELYRGVLQADWLHNIVPSAIEVVALYSLTIKFANSSR